MDNLLIEPTKYTPKVNLNCYWKKANYEDIGLQLMRSEIIDTAFRVNKDSERSSAWVSKVMR